VRIDSRAASRISVTITLFSSELRPAGFSLPARDHLQVRDGIAPSAGNSAGVRVSSALPGKTHLQIVAAGRDGIAFLAVHLEILAAEGQRPRITPCARVLHRIVDSSSTFG
jgi:hypothetical protein